MNNRLWAGVIGTCIAGLVASTATAATKITAVNVDNDGNVTSITLDDRDTKTVQNLIPVSGVASLASMASFFVPDDIIPDPGLRVSVVTDNSLRTGLGNLGAYKNAVRITFASPVYNGPGGDVVLIDLGTQQGASSEQWRISTKDGSAYVDYPVSDPINGYTSTNQNLNLVMFAEFDPKIGTVAALESADISAGKRTVITGFQFSAILIDLSHLGYAPGESTIELQLGSSGNNAEGAQHPGARADLMAAYGITTSPR